MFENVPTDLFDTQNTLITIENDFESVGELDDLSKRILAFAHTFTQQFLDESMNVIEIIPILSRSGAERDEMVLNQADFRIVVAIAREGSLMDTDVFESITAADGDVVTVWLDSRQQADTESVRNVMVYARFPHLH